MIWQSIAALFLFVCVFFAITALLDQLYEYREIPDCPEAWEEFERLKREEPERDWTVWLRDRHEKLIVLRGRRVK